MPPIMKRGFLTVSSFIVLMVCVSAAHAETFNVSGAGYDATANITQVGNQLTVVLTNNFADQVTVASSISGFQFSIAGFGGSGLGVVSQTGRAVTFSSNHVFNDVGGSSAADPIIWDLTNTAGSVTLNALGPNGPNETIAGVPSSTTANTVTYGSSNSSLENAPHNPIVAQSATFVFTVTGLPANAQFSNIVFLFGTTGTRVECVNCTTTHTPEPASMLLLGSGLAGVAAGLRKRRRKSKS